MQATGRVSHCAKPISWASQNLHYLGLITLVTGLGVLLAAIAYSKYSTSHRVHPRWEDSSGQGWYDPGHTYTIVGCNEAAQAALTGPAIAGMIVGIVPAIAALGLYRTNYLRRREMATIPAERLSEEQRSLDKREWVVRLLVVLAALGFAYGIASLLIRATRTETIAVPQNNTPFRETYHLIKPQTLNTAIGVSTPMMIAGAGATVLGFSGRKLLEPKSVPRSDVLN